MTFFARLGQKKENYKISLTILNIECHVNTDEDISVQVFWKRGKAQTDSTQLYEINHV